MNTSTTYTLETSPTSNHSKLRRWLIAFAAFALSVSAFYLEENWRGKRAWENCKREYEAHGHVADWAKYIPASLPDEQNIFKAPRMTEWFVKGASGTKSPLTERWKNPLTASAGSDANPITTPEEARDYLTWTDQLASDFDLIRDALKRPYGRMDGDYHSPVTVPVPNFVAVRIVAQTLAQRVHSYFVLNQPDKAISDLRLLHEIRRFLEPPPSGRPESLVAAMVNVAVAGLYIDAIADGLRMHVAHESQLIELERQIEATTLFEHVYAALEMEAASHVRICETLTESGYAAVREIFSNVGWSFWKDGKDPLFWLVNVAPRGWIYQNMTSVMRLYQGMWNSFDAGNSVIRPDKVDRAMNEMAATLETRSPFVLVGRITVPNYKRAIQTTARNQTKLNMALIASGVERYRLVHALYPEKLEQLVPEILGKIPADTIAGQPLHYRRTDDGKFLLYSVGWNETDEGGRQGLAKTPEGNPDYSKDDWAWKN